MTYINILILLILAHFVADFVLQNDRMAVEKCPGKDVVLHWTWWMAGHTALHRYFGVFETQNEARVFAADYREKYTKSDFITRSKIFPLCEVV